MPQDHQYEEPGFLKRYGFVIGIGGAVAVVAALMMGNHSKGGPSREIRTQEVVMVHPLPPPPPTPPPPEPPKEIVQKMIEQTPMDKPEEKPDDAPKDPPAVTTNLTGSGSDAFGLAAGGGGRGGTGGGGGARSRFGWYATQVQRAVQDALGRNHVLAQAEFTDRIKIWADTTGRVIRIKMELSTGNAAVDQAISDALEGLQLQEAPPGDMPMPILMRIVAHRRT